MKEIRKLTKASEKTEEIQILFAYFSFFVRSFVPLLKMLKGERELKMAFQIAKEYSCKEMICQR